MRLNKLTAVFATLLTLASLAFPFAGQASVQQGLGGKESAWDSYDPAEEIYQLKAMRARTLAREKLRSKPKPEPQPKAEAPAAPASAPTGPTLTVSSTAYCLQGTMANGQTVHAGAVAMNGPAFGTQYRVLNGPMAGSVLTVSDRIGHSSQFDVWMASCDAAIAYGRQTITIQQVGS